MNVTFSFGQIVLYHMVTKIHYRRCEIVHDCSATPSGILKLIPNTAILPSTNKTRFPRFSLNNDSVWKSHESAMRSFAFKFVRGHIDNGRGLADKW